MRAYLASSIAVTCAAALALPLALTTPAGAAAAPAAPVLRTDPAVSAGAVAVAAAPQGELAGSTQSLPLEPLEHLEHLEPQAHGRTVGRPAGAAGEQGLTRRDVRPFSLVGVVWDDANAPLHGTVQVRTRATTDGAWSAWQDLETHHDEHGADPASAEARSGAPRGATAPLWVGASDGVEVRVRPETEARAAASLPAGLRLELVDPGADPGQERGTDPGQGAGADRATDLGQGPGADRGAGLAALPAQDFAPTPASAPAPHAKSVARTPAFAPESGAAPEPGAAPESASTRPSASESESASATGSASASATGSASASATASASGFMRAAAPPAALTAEEAAAARVNAQLAPVGAAEIPALTRAQTLAALPSAATAAQAGRPARSAAKPYIGPRPKITTRKGWGADEKMRERGFVYTKTIKAAFVHHSATGNKYTCKQAPSVLRSIYRYHVKSLGWRDFGYNFAVDKCGNIYEGRAGGVAKPVLGAHTLGFNSNSMGIAVLGTYGSSSPPAAVVTAVARLTAWKLGLHGVNPKGKATLTSGGGNLYKKGRKVKFNAIAGHRDGFATECPGGRLYNKLGTARSASAKYQGRR
ncbi:peptidoglycan recognition protein [Streptomyces sp. NPDC101115]|uniref:peptidoglycan recognition protein family protein n=1 Tax=Streptomyces sp. NPDC101115 TaxID=3366106 RepID=UPI00381E6378